MGALVVSHRAFGIELKDAIDAKHRQRKAGINEGLLDLLDCRPATSKSQEALVVETSLQHRVTGEARRLKVVTVADCALEHDRAARLHTSSPQTWARATAHNHICNLIRLALTCIVRLVDGQRSVLHGSPVIALLHHVREFMREQSLSRMRCRPELPCSEYNVVSDSVCSCIHRPSQFSGLPIGMDPHIAEVTTEARLHKSAYRRIERLPRRTQYVVHNRRSDRSRGPGAMRIPLG